MRKSWHRPKRTPSRQYVCPFSDRDIAHSSGDMPWYGTEPKNQHEHETLLSDQLGQARVQAVPLFEPDARQ